MKLRKRLIATMACVIAMNNPIFGLEPINTVQTHTYETTKEVIIDIKNTTNVKNFNDTYYISTDFIKSYIRDVRLKWDSINKQTIITVNQKDYSVKVGAKELITEEGSYDLGNPVVTYKDRTFVPAKAFMQAVGGDVKYDAVQKTLLFNVPLTQEEILNQAPIADFDFIQESYIDGQEVKVIDKSIDLDGHNITNWQWQISGDRASYSSFAELGAHLEVGENVVALRVKDSLGKWSEWTNKKVVIEPNQIPLIKAVEVDKKTYQQGEPITFKDYEYENEEWEKITEEKWTYQCISQDNMPLIEGKPYKLFAEGTYHVTLQIKDEKGQWSLPYVKEIEVGKEVLQSELTYRFTEGRIGDILENYKNFNFQEFEAIIPTRVTYTGATLMMSNSPESVQTKGILYEDTIQGEGRILYHHKNASTDKSKKRFVIVMENVNEVPIKVVTMNASHKGPSTDVLYLGQQVAYDILGQNHEKHYNLAPGEKRYLFDTGNKNWYQGQTISGMIDLYSQSPVKITIAMVGDQTEIKHLENLVYLPRDGVHTRGTFPNADRYYTVDVPKDKPYKLMLGLPSGDIEQPIEGYDALTGQSTVNKGNYGVKYHIRTTAKVNTGLLLNPRGNIFKGAIGWANNRSYYAPSGHLNGAKSAANIGVVKAGETKELLYMLPNGSAAPVLICFIPENLWNYY